MSSKTKLKGSYSFLGSNDTNDDHELNDDLALTIPVGQIDAAGGAIDDDNDNMNSSNDGMLAGTCMRWCGGPLKKCEDCFALSYAQRMAGFAISAIGGLLMLFMSMFYVTSILVGNPGKFAFTYSLANLLLFASTLFMVGPTQQLKNMFKQHRAVASTVYILSMVGTIYCVWQAKTMFVVVPVLMIQFCSLLWYVASYIPYGQSCLQGTSVGLLRRMIGW
jgi:Got1/Sft2-like family